MPVQKKSGTLLNSPRIYIYECEENVYIEVLFIRLIMKSGCTEIENRLI